MRDLVQLILSCLMWRSQFDAAMRDLQAVLALESKVYEGGRVGPPEHAQNLPRVVAAFVYCQIGLILMTHHRNLVAALFQFRRAMVNVLLDK